MGPVGHENNCSFLLWYIHLIYLHKTLVHPGGSSYKCPTQIGSEIVHRVYWCRNFLECQNVQKVALISYDLAYSYTSKVSISSKQILVTQIRMMSPNVVINLHPSPHHNNSSCCELFQTQFIWVFTLQVIMPYMMIGSGHKWLYIASSKNGTYPGSTHHEISVMRHMPTTPFPSLYL